MGGVVIGRGVTIIAGPCVVETEEQTLAIARAVKAAGADALRGGAFKPRTSPRSFQGLERAGLEILSAAKLETGLPIVTEVLDTRDVALVCEHADVLQIGSHSMHNASLLKEVGRTDRPVLLKRAMSATIDEWLAAADYILGEGNGRVILCERGIRTFEEYTRNTLDLSAVAAVRSMTLLPVIADPSHATGRPHLIEPMSLAAIAAGADGLLIEVHNDPRSALSDGEQALTPDVFTRMMGKLRQMERFVAELS